MTYIEDNLDTVVGVVDELAGGDLLRGRQTAVRDGRVQHVDHADQLHLLRLHPSLL
mgnify:CR=1 FL=1